MAVGPGFCLSILVLPCPQSVSLARNFRSLPILSKYISKLLGVFNPCMCPLFLQHLSKISAFIMIDCGCVNFEGECTIVTGCHIIF